MSATQIMLERRRGTTTANVEPQLTSSAARRCCRKFLRFFPHGFRDEVYLDWERRYKWAAHQQWQEVLNREAYGELLSRRSYAEIAAHAVRIESRTNLLFSFEKMALRDALKSAGGSKEFATGLFDFLHGAGSLKTRFDNWVAVVSQLPRRQTRILTWPLLTVFGFIAQPAKHIFLKPRVTRQAATRYGFNFHYAPRPSWETYLDLRKFADTVAGDVRELAPRDMIDIQSFLWVQGSEEYDE